MGAKQKQQFARMAVIAAAGIGAVYLAGKSPKPAEEEIMDHMNYLVMDVAKQTYLASFVYVEEEKQVSFHQWIAGKAMQLIPLGMYTEEKKAVLTDIEDQETYEMILAKQANDENAIDENGNLIGEDIQSQEIVTTSGTAIDTSMEKLSDYEYLLGNFYTVDSSTMADPELLNAQKLLAKDLKINALSDGPKVLIYHTHSQEAFADSIAGDVNTTIVGIGSYLASILNQKYGIETLHHTGVYDYVDGKLDRSKAYQLAEPEIQAILSANPSIEVVIDLHRDGVADTTHLVTQINGKPTAQIMFFNGLSRTRANGDISYLANPYIEDNLAFSLQMQIAATNKYPGFTRHIFLRAYRYNMHVKPKTLLIEAGAQTNTVEEMKNAMEVLADTLSIVLTK
ncbi:MAG: stage II sporulation protein P [Dorea sp.]|uniref:stage II sporulation protein P n=1 Tax=Dorea sp. YH-dor226 TaxID=3151119 RepID=UPI0030464A5A|nr:stage II sporulation protein P [Dorea sp.]